MAGFVQLYHFIPEPHFSRSLTNLELENSAFFLLSSSKMVDRKVNGKCCGRFLTKREIHKIVYCMIKAENPRNPKNLRTRPNQLTN